MERRVRPSLGRPSHEKAIRRPDISPRFKGGNLQKIAELVDLGQAKFLYLGRRGLLFRPWPVAFVWGEILTIDRHGPFLGLNGFQRFRPPPAAAGQDRFSCRWWAVGSIFCWLVLGGAKLFQQLGNRPCPPVLAMCPVFRIVYYTGFIVFSEQWSWACLVHGRCWRIVFGAMACGRSYAPRAVSRHRQSILILCWTPANRRSRSLGPWWAQGLGASPSSQARKAVQCAEVFGDTVSRQWRPLFMLGRWTGALSLVL